MQGRNGFVDPVGVIVTKVLLQQWRGDGFWEWRGIGTRRVASGARLVVEEAERRLAGAVRHERRI
jgi:hypothetical protein